MKVFNKKKNVFILFAILIIMACSLVFLNKNTELFKSKVVAEEKFAPTFVYDGISLSDDELAQLKTNMMFGRSMTIDHADRCAYSLNGDTLTFTDLVVNGCEDASLNIGFDDLFISGYERKIYENGEGIPYRIYKNDLKIIVDGEENGVSNNADLNDSLNLSDVKYPLYIGDIINKSNINVTVSYVAEATITNGFNVASVSYSDSYKVVYKRKLLNTIIVNGEKLDTAGTFIKSTDFNQQTAVEKATKINVQDGTDSVIVKIDADNSDSVICLANTNCISNNNNGTFSLARGTELDNLHYGDNIVKIYPKEGGEYIYFYNIYLLDSRATVKTVRPTTSRGAENDFYNVSGTFSNDGYVSLPMIPGVVDVGSNGSLGAVADGSNSGNQKRLFTVVVDSPKSSVGFYKEDNGEIVRVPVEKVLGTNDEFAIMDENYAVYFPMSVGYNYKDILYKFDVVSETNETIVYTYQDRYIDNRNSINLVTVTDGEKEYGSGIKENSSLYTINVPRTLSQNAKVKIGLNAKYEKLVEIVDGKPEAATSANQVAKLTKNSEGYYEYTLAGFSDSENSIYVRVTNESDEVVINEIKLNRADATIKSLTVDNTSSPDFSAIPANDQIIKFELSEKYLDINNFVRLNIELNNTSALGELYSTDSTFTNDTHIVYDSGYNLSDLKVGHNYFKIITKPGISDEYDEVNKMVYKIDIYVMSSNTNIKVVSIDDVDYGYEGSNTIEINPVDFSKTSVSYKIETENENAKVVSNSSSNTIEGKVGTIGLNVGNNTISYRIVAEDGSILDYSILIRRLNNDAGLSELKLGSSTTSIIENGKYSYEHVVANNTTSVALKMNTNDKNAIVKVNGTNITYNSTAKAYSSTVSLNKDSLITDVRIRVVAENGNEQEYVLLIRKKSTDNSLEKLEVELPDGTKLTPTVGTDASKYSLTLPSGTTDVKIIPTPTDRNATIDSTKLDVTGLLVGSGTSTKPNNRSFTVKSENSETKTYTISFYVLSNDASLKSLALGSGSLSPAFNKDVFEYSATVANSVTSLTVTPATTYAKASAEVTGNTDLKVGDNKVTIKVTSEEGKDTKTYTVNVHRKSNDSSIEKIKVPEFVAYNVDEKDSKIYNITIPEGTPNFDITIVPNHAGATVFNSSNVRLTDNILTIKSSTSTSQTIKFVVKAEDTSATTTYTLNVYRISKDVYLDDLVVKGYDFETQFSKDKVQYSINVPSNISSLEVKAISNNPDLEVIVDKATSKNGDYSVVPIYTNIGEVHVIVRNKSNTGQSRLYKIYLLRQDPTTPSNPGDDTPTNPGDDTPTNPGDNTPTNPGDNTPSNPGEEQKKVEIKHSVVPNSDSNIKFILEKFKDGNKVVVYDANYYVNNVLSQPNGEITFELPLPEGMNKDLVTVYRAEKDGSLSLISSKVVGDVIRITTSHFSYYVVSEDGQIKDATSVTIPYQQENESEEEYLLRVKGEVSNQIKNSNDFKVTEKEDGTLVLTVSNDKTSIDLSSITSKYPDVTVSGNTDLKVGENTVTISFKINGVTTNLELIVVREEAKASATDKTDDKDKKDDKVVENPNTGIFISVLSIVALVLLVKYRNILKPKLFRL